MTKRNERTSPRVGKIAAKYTPMTFDQFCDRLLTVGKARRVFGDIRALAGSCLTQTADKAEVQRLRERLEMTHCYVFKNGKSVKRKVKPGEYIPDGIECRDETIRLQDQYIKELQAKVRAGKTSPNEARALAGKPPLPTTKPKRPAARPKRRRT